MFLNRTTVRSFVAQAGKNLLDTLFPLRCLGCRTKGTWLCTVCKQSIILRLEQHCPLCFHHITPSGEVCFACRDSASPALDGLFVAASYRDSLLSHTIHTYKYRFIPDLSLPLAHLLKNALERSSLPLPDAIMPIPLHPRRLRFRGFNQSLLLAEKLAAILTPGMEIPLLSDVLLRTRYTKPQMKTDSREERLANLKNAFALAEEKEAVIRDKYIWLVDDVATTGTTLEECATILKKHGVKTVFGIVLAR